MNARKLILALATATTFVSCAGMPAGDMTRPEYWGDYFLDKYAAERAAAMSLEPGPIPLDEPRTVLLITGVTIPAVWFDPIAARLQRDGFRTVVYEPPALLSGDLFENAQALADVVDAVRAQTGEEKIDILAECTGGLIARHYIQALGGNAHVSRMVTFISPQHGVDKAPWAESIVGWPALEDLTPGSLFLDTVNNAPLPADVPITSIYTCTDEYIQPYDTSIIPGAKNIGLCNEFVGHFQFFYDPEIYKIMHAELTAPIPGQPEDPADPGDPADPSDPADPADPGDPTVVPDDLDPGEDPAGDDGGSAEAPTTGGGCSTSGGGAEGFVAMSMLALGLVAARRRSVR